MHLIYRPVYRPFYSLLNIVSVLCLSGGIFFSAVGLQAQTKKESKPAKPAPPLPVEEQIAKIDPLKDEQIPGFSLAKIDTLMCADSSGRYVATLKHDAKNTYIFDSLEGRKYQFNRVAGIPNEYLGNWPSQKSVTEDTSAQDNNYFINAIDLDSTDQIFGKKSYIELSFSSNKPIQWTSSQRSLGPFLRYFGQSPFDGVNKWTTLKCDHVQKDSPLLKVEGGLRVWSYLNKVMKQSVGLATWAADYKAGKFNFQGRVSDGWFSPMVKACRQLSSDQFAVPTAPASNDMMLTDLMARWKKAAAAAAETCGVIHTEARVVLFRNYGQRVSALKKIGEAVTPLITENYKLVYFYPITNDSPLKSGEDAKPLQIPVLDR